MAACPAFKARRSLLRHDTRACTMLVAAGKNSYTLYFGMLYTLSVTAYRSVTTHTPQSHLDTYTMVRVKNTNDENTVL